MKVLGIAGSPRAGGNTDQLLAELMRGAASQGATVRTLFLSDLRIAPCLHCDSCFKKGECKLGDDMQMVYREMESADRIVLASPIHFMGVTAQMKAMIDRCQSLWARKYVLKIPPLGDKRERKGFFISTAGRKVANAFDGALLTVKSLFTVLDVTYAGELLFRNIDEKGAIAKHPDALEQAFLAGQKLVADAPEG
ncbi:MAG: flavodoxin family protein [Dehalococcoidales bacterium]|nr:flavodoxin family protein [Dehalococcoidales bacterium]